MASNDSAADGQRSSVEVMDTIPESRAASPTIPAPTLSPTREAPEGMGLPPQLRRPALSPTARNFPEQGGERLPGRRRGHSTSETLQPVTSNASRARAGSTSSSRQVRFPALERRATGNPGMRKRTTTWNLNGPSALQRQATVRRRGTLAPPALSTGFDMGEARSDAGFTLAGAGSPIDNIIANQPYVDPGYVELNPAYEAPANTRPVWGLAKPLPRVVRAGMIPTRTEILQQAPQQSEHERRAEEEFDLEAGRVESTLNPNKISDALRTAQQDREFRLLRRYTGQNVGGPDLGRRPSVASNLPRRSTDRFGKLDGQNSIAGSHTGNLGRLDSVQEQQTPDEANHTNEDGWLADHAGADTPVHDGSEPEEWIEDPEELKPYDPELDEIHNLHTYWSVIRLKFREPLAELLAMTCQLTIGFAADLVVTTTGTSATTNANWAWGLASMIGIYIAGGISGAHLNPAVSIMLWIFRGFPLRKIPGYALAQLVGAFLAALIAFGLYRTNIIEYAGSADMATSGTSSAFVTHPQYSYIDASTAFFTEFVGTAILAVVVLALGDDSNAPPGAGMNAFIMGLVITVLLMAFGTNTGLALNPARDFGPRLALLALGYGKANTFPSAYWFWGAWCGPIAGALFGAFLYDAAIFVGGESPVNYPRKRIKRAMRKKKAKWGRRFKKVAGFSVSMPLRRPRYASDDWHFDVREDE